MEQKLNKQRPGDQGLTDLGDGLRVSKDHVQIAAFGAIDELNCVIGLLITVKDLPEPMAHLLTRVQQELIQISNDITQSTCSIHDLHIQWLDKEIHSPRRNRCCSARTSGARDLSPCRTNISLTVATKKN